MTIYIDVTEVVAIRATTGVQRVVREIVRHGMAIAPARGQEVVPVVAVGRTLHRLNADGMALLDAPSGSAGPPGRGPAARFKTLLRQHAFGLFGLAQRIGFHRRMRRIVQAGAEHKPVTPGQEDVVVLIDTFWNGSSVLSAARRARAAGARIALVVYDLFPIRQPAAVDAQLAHVFPALLDQALAIADAVLTISRQVGADVADLCRSQVSHDRIRHFYLGQDFAAPAERRNGPLPEGYVRTPGTRYLMVGTLEPRRGHAYVLDAFERLWAEGGEQALLLIGRIGWQMEEFLTRCRSHPQLGTRLFLIHDASDATLAGAITTADAIIVASYFEGFGLPLVEALLADKPVLASDIPIFREIADGTPLFFRCGDPEALAAAVHIFEQDPRPWQDRAAAFRWLDWNQSARMFLDQMSDALSPGGAGGVPTSRKSIA